MGGKFWDLSELNVRNVHEAWSTAFCLPRHTWQVSSCYSLGHLRALGTSTCTLVSAHSMLPNSVTALKKPMKTHEPWMRSAQLLPKGIKLGKHLQALASEFLHF